MGRMTVDPVAALGEIAEKPHFVSGLGVAALTIYGRTLTSPLPWDSGGMDLAKGFLSVFVGGLFRWVGLALLVHFLTRSFNKNGRWISFLAVTGWGSLVLWPSLAFRFVPPGRVVQGAGFFFGGLFFMVWWWGLQKVYGWGKRQAFFLLFIPTTLFVGFTVLPKIVFSLLASASFFP